MQRYDIINHLISRYNLQNYLEIGTQHGNNFREIKLPRNQKKCVDIVKAFNDLDYTMSSDDFFAQNKELFDIIFIDGDHSYEQSYKDIQHAIQIINKNKEIEHAAIVCHDSFPSLKEHTDPGSMGTVYKSIVRLIQERRDIKINVVNTDCGCAVIKKDFGSSTCDWPAVDFSLLEYDNFIKNPQKNINLISVEEFKNIY